ncbi:coiled-coil domain-containing protein 96 [Spea bombifrons]|uniref:coiled-coil domain-containing protein 96 n=1 Tax=Spea bombifrons TaxID=233779 RepID=UPI00234AFFDB|nr:coiled-coil domain-containing protein 96 [Spea bombifrons]
MESTVTDVENVDTNSFTDAETGSQEPRPPLPDTANGAKENLSLTEDDKHHGVGEEGGEELDKDERGDKEVSASEEGGHEKEGTQLLDTREEGDYEEAPGTDEEKTGEEAVKEMVAVTGANTRSQEQAEEDNTQPPVSDHQTQPTETSDPSKMTENMSDTGISEMDGAVTVSPEVDDTEDKEDQTKSVSQDEGDGRDDEDIKPEDGESEESDTEDEMKEILIQQYQALVLEREKVQQQNTQLQHKLYEYFRRKKGEDTRPEGDKHVPDQEQRYVKYLSTLEEVRKKFMLDADCHQQEINQLRAECEDVVNRVDMEWAAFQEHKKKITLYGHHGVGKRVSPVLVQEIEQLQAREERKEKEVIQVRLENIKLKNKIQRFESTLKSKEELSEGLHLIDFEQLKIENQTYNEKIEERNEELLKLRKKITNTVQVLTHLKEKLQSVQAENQEKRERLMQVEEVVARKRDILTKTKQARDSLRIDNLKLKQQCGLLGNKTLLRDFEDKVDATEELRQKLDVLKRRHAELTLASKGVIKKIDEAKLAMKEI